MRSSHTANIPQVNSYLVFTTQYCQDFRPAAVWPHCIYLSALGTEDWQVLGARSNSVITACQDHRLAEWSHWTTLSILVSWSATVLLFGRVVPTGFQCLSFLASYHLLLDFPCTCIEEQGPSISISCWLPENIYNAMDPQTNRYEHRLNNVNNI